ncbi:MAG: lipopolysaccharide biosynthesis protein [Paludibacter sp.]|jgi:O-antigen/teichoic acid export membrane protein|nr:lipopolysaccharide biosynthesis protein [Paludibacter sp.]
MQIGRKDLLWNYAATSMRILSGIIVLPVTLRMLPSEDMGIWTLFLSLMTITLLLDFGFSNSFSRNITYVYSGVKELKTKGYTVAETSEIDYGLLKSILSAMKRYYGIAALIFLVIFAAGSPFYLLSALEHYSGDKQTIWIAWFIFGGVLAYELYTYYYNAILTGRGLVKRNTQILVVSQFVRIIVTIVLLLLDFGIISLVIGMLISDIVNRTLLYAVFFDKETKQNLSNSVLSVPVSEVIKLLAPNSIKLGLVFLSIFLRSKAIVLIAPAFLSLSEIAEYGISKQIVDLIASLGVAWFFTFYPKLSQYSVQEKRNDIKRLYIKGTTALLLITVVLGGLFILLGNPILIFIHSKTLLLSGGYLFLMLLFMFLEQNQGIAQNVILAKNEVAFFKANIFSGVFSVLLLLVMFKYTSFGVLSLILCTGLTMTAYLNWRLPFVLIKKLNLTLHDYITVISQFWKENKIHKTI